MCGITGVIADGCTGNLTPDLERMTDAIRHRGPDDEGYYQSQFADDCFVGLGHRRLSIIDLSTGKQPIGNEDGSVQIVFNGEIYNFRELRDELVERGHTFVTQSDTETIVHAYEEFGENCVEHLRGMFAFAIWDQNKEKLFLARDRFGQKPLFLFERKGLLLFASEIKALCTWPGIEPEVNESVIPDYMTYRYVPGPDTLLQGIRKLEPGSYAVWQQGQLSERRYYTPPDQKLPGKTTIPEDPIGAFLDKLDEAVRIRMVSDVPFGAFLSGGIDSSAVVALMARHSNLPVKTFSVGFTESAYSELEYAREIATRFSTDHHELRISADDLIEELPGLIAFRDAPVSEPSDIPIYLLAKEARKTVKMVLTGEGSDEFLGGYRKHVYENYVTNYLHIPRVLRKKLVEPVVRSLPYRFRSVKTGVANMGTESWTERMPQWFGALSVSSRSELVAIDDVGTSGDEFQFAISPGNSALRSILYFDQTSWLPDNLLERGDRMTMAASLEARMPFMDHELAEFASALPDQFRVRGRSTKWILRQAVQRLLPARIIDRPKIGFRVPVNEWFQGPMRDYLRAHLCGSDSIVRRYFHASTLDGVVDEHIRGRQNHEKLLWTLLNLEIWHRLRYEEIH
ncbi:MAG: asparagine synthase (glutamine-hydrolyzing) [Woeseiaceae bacterium]